MSTLSFYASGFISPYRNDEEEIQAAESRGPGDPENVYET